VRKLFKKLRGCLHQNLGLARALAEDPSDAGPIARLETPASPSTTVDAPDTSKSLLSIPLSPNKSANRRSLVGGGTTKVLADLQAGVMNARNALENTKTQLRLSQRANAQLTRLRLENDGLNNVVTRKERLLQEVWRFYSKFPRD
jgi:hypothetical protein